jgi:hypothetical protein
MPGQMLRYRAASFWSRAYASDLSLGFYTQDEVKDFAEPTRNVTPISPIKPIEKEIEPETEVIEAEIMPVEKPIEVAIEKKIKPERKLTLQELIDNAED